MLINVMTVQLDLVVIEMQYNSLGLHTQWFDNVSYKSEVLKYCIW